MYVLFRTRAKHKDRTYGVYGDCNQHRLYLHVLYCLYTTYMYCTVYLRPTSTVLFIYDLHLELFIYDLHLLYCLYTTYMYCTVYLWPTSTVLFIYDLHFELFIYDLHLLSCLYATYMYRTVYIRPTCTVLFIYYLRVLYFLGHHEYRVYGVYGDCTQHRLHLHLLYCLYTTYMYCTV